MAGVVAALLCAAGCALPHAPGTEPATAQVQPSDKHYQAARAALMRGDLEKANVEVKLALQDGPLDAKSHYLFGCLLEMKGEHERAIVGFQRAVALDSTNPEALYNPGTLLLRQGQAVPAAPLLENAVWIRPDHVPTWTTLPSTAVRWRRTGNGRASGLGYASASSRCPSAMMTRSPFWVQMACDLLAVQVMGQLQRGPPAGSRRRP
jgi:tetratricopeptide (TPR) repeat protein